jgi:hypothetical protein
MEDGSLMEDGGGKMEDVGGCHAEALEACVMGSGHEIVFGYVVPHVVLRQAQHDNLWVGAR